MTQSEFAAIIAETKPVVLAAIRRYLFSEYAHMADDAAQETYLRAYRALAKNSLKEKSKLKSYLYTIARRESLRINARCDREIKKTEKILEARKSGDLYHSDSTAGIDKAIVLEALQRIPAVYADVLHLLLDGKKIKEISGELQLKPGTIKSRTHRGLKLLRSAIGY